MLKHLQRTPFTAKGYCRARQESIYLFLFIIYQMEAVIPIERDIFSGRRVFAFKIIITVIQYRYIYCVFVDQL